MVEAGLAPLRGLADDLSSLRVRALARSDPALNSLARVLKPHQHAGLQWLLQLWEERRHGILADEMGVGKTVQVIALLAAIAERGDARPSLVVVPKTVLDDWIKECNDWYPSASVLRLHAVESQAKDRPGILELLDRVADLSSHTIVLSTFEFVARRRVRKALAKVEWACLVVDEAQRLKSDASLLRESLALIVVSASVRLLLTGTPLQNNLKELWALLRFMYPAVLAGCTESFLALCSDEHLQGAAREKHYAHLRGYVAPFMLRRLLADVEVRLPPRFKYSVRLSLTPLQRREYDAVHSDEPKHHNKRSRIANHVGLVRPLEAPSELRDGSSKVVFLGRMLSRMDLPRHKTLIFSQFTMVLDVLEDYLVSEGYEVCRFDGTIAAEERNASLDDFRTNPNANICLISTRAGGCGLNVPQADTVIIFDADYNPHNDSQAAARIYRLTQEKPVLQVALSAAVSEEKRRHSFQARKRRLECDLLEDALAQEGAADETISLFDPTDAELSRMLSRESGASL